jgi:hypothetical protein
MLRKVPTDSWRSYFACLTRYAAGRRPGHVLLTRIQTAVDGLQI